MIETHGLYLDRMVKKVLLLSPKVGREQNLLIQVKDLFSTILQFRDATDSFYNYCLSESARRDQGQDTDRGVFTGVDQDTENQQLRDTLPRIRRRIKEYGSTFSERVQGIVYGLQSHTDLDCRFLGTRLSFSDFYKTKKEQQVQQQQRP